MAQEPTLTHDPRTGLEFIKVPPKYVSTFRDNTKRALDGRAIHWLSDVKKKNRHWNDNKRILMITDRTMCLCMQSDGMVTRCVRIEDVKEVIEQGHDANDPQASKRIALKITESQGADGKFDLLFEVEDPAHKIAILNIIKKVYTRVSGGKELKVVELGAEGGKDGEQLAEKLWLKKPREWQNKVDAVTPIRKIEEECGLTQQPQPTPAQQPPQQSQQPSPAGAADEGPYDDEVPFDNREQQWADQDRQAEFEDWQAREMQRDRDRALVQQEFERIRAGLREHLEGFTRDEFDEMQREIEMYVAQVEERDAEIDALKESIQTLTDNPEFWANCPRCRDWMHREEAHPTPALLKRRELERKVEDYQQLIQHLQLTRCGGGRLNGGLSEPAQVAQLRQKLDDQQAKVRELQRLIVDNPYPTEDVRLKAEQIAQGDDPVVTDTPALRELHERADRLDRELVTKERSLRHQRNVMHDAFRRQVHELHRVRRQFQEYDRQIVNYLEKVFSANAFPQGASAHGQSARQLAEAAAQAARQAATPGAFPHHTVGVSMPESGIEPLSHRVGSRSAASPIGQFVAPNVVSERSSPSPAPPNGAHAWQQHRRRNL